MPDDFQAFMISPNLSLADGGDDWLAESLEEDAPFPEGSILAKIWARMEASKPSAAQIVMSESVWSGVTWIDHA